MCKQCRIFLQDFLETGISKKLALANFTRAKSFVTILPELLDWMYRIYLRVPKEKFLKARESASRIARRERPLHEYEYILFTATFNMLRFEVPWLREEVLYLEPLLYESGFIKYKKRSFENNAQNYIAYMTTRALICLYNIHEEHVNPKGIFTPIANPIQLEDKEDMESCADKDDYQSAVLAEDDDLYN
jgi:hypothetical protein